MSERKLLSYATCWMPFVLDLRSVWAVFFLRTHELFALQVVIVSTCISSCSIPRLFALFLGCQIFQNKNVKVKSSFVIHA